MAGEDLVFVVNGEKFEVFLVDPSTTLLEFLRTNTHVKSAKLSCGEGDCGACIVILSKYDPVLRPSRGIFYKLFRDPSLQHKWVFHKHIRGTWKH